MKSPLFMSTQFILFSANERMSWRWIFDWLDNISSNFQRKSQITQSLRTLTLKAENLIFFQGLTNETVYSNYPKIIHKFIGTSAVHSLNCCWVQHNRWRNNGQVQFGIWLPRGFKYIQKHCNFGQWEAKIVRNTK